jgi:hypothetical protein
MVHGLRFRSKISVAKAKSGGAFRAIAVLRPSAAEASLAFGRRSSRRSSMTRVLFAGLFHETHTFLPEPTPLAGF